MANYGSPNASKDNLRISGNVVIAGLEVISGVNITVQVSGEVVYVNTSGTTVQVSGTVSVVSGTGVAISGQSVYAYISGGSVNASISGDVVYVGEMFSVVKNLGSSASTLVSVSYTAIQPTVLNTANLNLAASPSTVYSGTLTISVVTSSTTFPFVRTLMEYNMLDNPTAKSISYYPDSPLLVASGDVISIIYANNTVECAESRVEMILQPKM